MSAISTPTWDNVEDYGASAPSREGNSMQIWMRPTINWPLRCESTMSRSDADEMLGLRLDSLGLVNNFWTLSIAIILIVVAMQCSYYHMK